MGNKAWLNLQHIKIQQLSKKLAWQNFKYTVTTVPDPLTVELYIPGKIHKRCHIELIKTAGIDLFPSQVRDDA